MADFIDSTAFNFEQGQRARKLFAAVLDALQLKSPANRIAIDGRSAAAQPAPMLDMRACTIRATSLSTATGGSIPLIT